MLLLLIFVSYPPSSAATVSAANLRSIEPAEPADEPDGLANPGATDAERGDLRHGNLLAKHQQQHEPDLRRPADDAPAGTAYQLWTNEWHVVQRTATVRYSTGRIEELRFRFEKVFD